MFLRFKNSKQHTSSVSSLGKPLHIEEYCDPLFIRIYGRDSHMEDVTPGSAPFRDIQMMVPAKKHSTGCLQRRAALQEKQPRQV